MPSCGASFSMTYLVKPKPPNPPRELFVPTRPDFRDDKFYCDFNLDLSTLSDDELTYHDTMAQYSASAINANLYAYGNEEVLDERTKGKLERMRHAKAIYNAYRAKINVERAKRKRARPPGYPIEHYFMLAAKKILPGGIFEEILENAKEHSPWHK